MNSFQDLTRRAIGIPVFFAVAGLLLLCQTAESAKNNAATAQKSPAQAQGTSSTEVKNAPAVSGTASAKTSVTEQRKLMVYYFHTTFRCHSCNTIERLTKEAVETGFGDQLKNGRVQFQSINIETPGNEHFAETYKLYTKSVILSDLKNGKEASWKNLDQVWTLLREENKFIDYVKKEIFAYL